MSKRMLVPAAVALLAAFTGEAMAHAHLKAAQPAVGATVAAAPGALTLSFTEGLSVKFSGVTVTGPNGGKVATGAVALGAGSDSTLVVPLPAALPAGAYKVEWHALSTDGHRTTGSYRFIVKP